MDFSLVLEARDRLRGAAHLTPVMTSRTLDQICGCQVFLKCENFQRAGAFKFRGAYNALSSLTPEQKAAGVVTYSSGNHAQATALAGQVLGVPVTVVMPSDAPQVKRLATEGYGAEVVTYNPGEREREDIAAEIQAERGLSTVPPFDHPLVIAGQGTAALELAGQVEGLENILAPCGGGGLLSGTALTASAQWPGARVHGVEPEGADNGGRAFRSGRIETVPHPVTMADGLKPKALGQHTFAVIGEHVHQMHTVSEAEIRSTLEFLWTRMKLVVEPSGATALAALFHQKVENPGPRAGVIISGGNADIAAVSAWFQAPQA